MFSSHISDLDDEFWQKYQSEHALTFCPPAVLSPCTGSLVRTSSSPCKQRSGSSEYVPAVVRVLVYAAAECSPLLSMPSLPVGYSGNAQRWLSVQEIATETNAIETRQDVAKIAIGLIFFWVFEKFTRKTVGYFCVPLVWEQGAWRHTLIRTATLMSYSYFSPIALRM